MEVVVVQVGPWWSQFQRFAAAPYRTPFFWDQNPGSKVWRKRMQNPGCPNLNPWKHLGFHKYIRERLPSHQSLIRLRSFFQSHGYPRCPQDASHCSTKDIFHVSFSCYLRYLIHRSSSAPDTYDRTSVLKESRTRLSCNHDAMVLDSWTELRLSLSDRCLRKITRPYTVLTS